MAYENSIAPTILKILKELFGISKGKKNKRQTQVAYSLCKVHAFTFIQLYSSMRYKNFLWRNAYNCGVMRTRDVN